MPTAHYIEITQREITCKAITNFYRASAHWRAILI